MEAATFHFQLSEDEHRKQRFRAAMRHNLTAYAFLAPILVFFLVFMALPVVWLFYLSFQHDGILAPAQFAGLDNWRRRWPRPQMHWQHALLLRHGDTDGFRARHDRRAVA
jgi:ABC-type sugar transport system permease subunit